MKTKNLKIRQWNIWLSAGYSMCVIKDSIFFGKKKLRKGLECASDARSISFHYHRFFHAPYQSLSEEANKTFNFFRVDQSRRHERYIFPCFIKTSSQNDEPCRYRAFKVCSHCVIQTSSRSRNIGLCINWILKVLYSIEIEVSKYVHCYVETVFFM